MVRIDGKMALVEPASYQIYFDLLKAVEGAQSVELASDARFEKTVLLAREFCCLDFWSV